MKKGKLNFPSTYFLLYPLLGMIYIRTYTTDTNTILGYGLSQLGYLMIASGIIKGTFLVFVNSGDLLTKNALRIINHLYKKNDKVDFIFGTVKRNYTTGPIIKSGYNKLKLNYNFDFATSHSTGFYIKLQSLKKVGIFNTNYKCSADYDLYYRVIIKNNLKGISTNKNKIIGIMRSGGYSSKISFFQHLLEETNIRYNNGQNIFFVFLIFCNAIFKFFLKKIY